MANQKMRAPDFEYIRAHRAEMSERQLAESIGVSKTTVHRAIKRLGLMPGGDPPPPPGRPVPQQGDEPRDRVVLLEGLARSLEAAMSIAAPASLPGLAKEYRATLEELDALRRAREPSEPRKAEVKVTSFGAIRARRAAPGEAAAN